MSRVHTAPVSPRALSATAMALLVVPKSMPIAGVIRRVMTGSGECANVDWTFAGLSMPAWTLACYVALGAFALWAAFRRR